MARYFAHKLFKDIPGTKLSSELSLFPVIVQALESAVHSLNRSGTFVKRRVQLDFIFEKDLLMALATHASMPAAPCSEEHRIEVFAASFMSGAARFENGWSFGWSSTMHRYKVRGKPFLIEVVWGGSGSKSTVEFNDKLYNEQGWLVYEEGHIAETFTPAQQEMVLGSRPYALSVLERNML